MKVIYYLFINYLLHFFELQKLASTLLGVNVAVVDVARIDVAAVDTLLDWVLNFYNESNLLSIYYMFLSYRNLCRRCWASMWLSSTWLALTSLSSTWLALTMLLSTGLSLTWLALTWGLPTQPLGFDFTGRRGSRRSFVSTHPHLLVPPPPHPTSSPSSSSCVPSSSGYMADVDVVRLM